MNLFKSNLFYFGLFGLIIISALISNFSKYFFTKNYSYIVEATCNPSEEFCFVRDCSQDECPPNELSIYKQYYIKATDFPNCSDSSCKTECEYNLFECEPIPCNSEIGDECITETQ